MRLQRYGLIFLAMYLVFIAGGYAVNVPVIRWFHHIFMSVLTGGWLLWRIRYQRGLPPSPLNTPLLAMLILGFATVPFSYDPRMALENMWLPVIFAISFWFIVNAFHRAQERLLIEILFLVTGMVIFLSIVQVTDAWFGWMGFIRSPEESWIQFIGTGVSFPFTTDLRIFLPLGVSTQVAGFVAPVIIIALAWAISTQKKAVRIVLSLMIVLLVIILLLTFSRGGLLALIAGLSAFFILRILQSNRVQALFTRRNVIIAGILFTVAIGVTGTVLSISSQSSRRVGDGLRMDLWRSAINMTVDNPVTGVGTGLYGRAFRDYRDPEFADDRLATAHNIYLNITAEHGLMVIFILVGTLGITGRSWWRLRSEASSDPEGLIRLNGMMAGLLAFSFHNLFDTLNTYASISLFALMIVYCTVQPAKSRLEERRKGNQGLAIGLLIVVLAYGIWFVAIVDRAHSHFINSNARDYEQLEEAQLARQIDPYLSLYTLQEIYLLERDVLENPESADLEGAIAHYKEAILLEPTWQTGMINLAGLYEANNQAELALQWLERAQEIRFTVGAYLNYARIAEANNLADAEDIITDYTLSLQRTPYLPLSNFWSATPLREQALLDYMDLIAPDWQYRIAEVHFSEQVGGFVPDNPESATDWWITGQYALTIEEDREMAIEAFTRAIELAPGNGDYYASRARAYGQDDIESAEGDLQLARFTGTRDEYPDAIWATLVTEPDEIESYRRSALPGFRYSQDFEGVLFGGRTATFLLYDAVRQPGRGDSVMQIWYDLATEYEAQGDIDSAIEVYEAINRLSPEDNRADEAITRLQNEN